MLPDAISFNWMRKETQAMKTMKWKYWQELTREGLKVLIIKFSSRLFITLYSLRWLHCSIWKSYLFVFLSSSDVKTSTAVRWNDEAVHFSSFTFRRISLRWVDLTSVFFWNSDNSHRLKFLLLQKVITQWAYYKDYNRISIEFIIDN